MHLAFVDESDIYLAGEKCLLYGVYVCADLANLASQIYRLRTQHRLEPRQELKWTLDTGDRDRNAKIKEDLLGQTHTGEDWFLVSITRGRNKAEAFLRSIQQVHAHFVKSAIASFGLIYDRDSVPDRRPAEQLLLNAKGSTCTLFAEASSHLTHGMAVADAFAAAYAYMVHKQDAEKLPQVEVHPDLFIRLDELFWEFFRRRIPGEILFNRDHHEEEDIARAETAYRHTLGHGLILDPALSDEQRARVACLVDLHLGCTV